MRRTHIASLRKSDEALAQLRPRTRVSNWAQPQRSTEVGGAWRACSSQAISYSATRSQCSGSTIVQADALPSVPAGDDGGWLAATERFSQTSLAAAVPAAASLGVAAH